MSLLIYGATGYTGQLIAREAVARGLRPTLAARSPEALGRLGDELGLRTVTVSLDDGENLARALEGHVAVLHCAGPFSLTFAPMVAACLRRRVHYLDITGEIAVFETLARRDADATQAGITLLPGVGFDVVPSDCLAAHLARRLPGAARLTLAFEASGGISRGTALTMVLNVGRGGAVRRDGRIVPVPLAWKTRQVDFGEGPRHTMTLPWGDVATAYHSTGIGNIEVYTSVPPGRIRLLRGLRWLAPFAGWGPIRRLIAGMVRRRVTGPSGAARAAGHSVCWGQVEDDAGRRATARVRGPEGYTLTALAAVRAAERVVAGRAPAGYQTPATAFGPDFVLEVPGVERQDLD